MMLKEKGLFLRKKYSQKQGQICMHVDKVTYIKMILKTVLYLLSQATFTVSFTTEAQAIEERNFEKLCQADLSVYNIEISS